MKSPYAALVRQYLTGDADAAVRALLSWPPEQVAASVHPLSSRAELDAAIALHTEAGCRSRSAPVFEQHFWITQRAMAAMASRMRATPLRRYWIRAIATGSAAHASRIAPGDREIEALVLVALGAQMESPTDAMLEAQGDFDHPRVPEADLARAAATYREALALNDEMWEARLRLGSALGRLHQADEAMAQLERVRTQANDRPASGISPRCRSPRFTRRLAGARPLARRTTRPSARFLTDSSRRRRSPICWSRQGARPKAERSCRTRWRASLADVPRSDPWYEYLYSSVSQMERHLAALREVVRRESEVAK